MNASRSPSLFVAAALAALLGFAPAAAHDPSSQDKLGTIRFEVTGKPAARDHVIRGVKLVHHMMYPEADREFARASELDPDCALAWWGRAMTLIHPLWPDVPTDDDRARGAGFIRRGLESRSATPRERAYLETLDAFFAAPAGTDYPSGLRALDQAWGRLADRHPDDLDAAAFAALFHLAPVRFASKDKSNRHQLESAAQIARILEKIPDHPGAQHYKIHAHDFPLLADRALEVCDTYGGIAPDVPHALHMPSHIFTRRGMWDKSIDYNLRSAAAAKKIEGGKDTINGHYAHALDYLVYAYLQRGEHEKARAIARDITASTGPYAKAQVATMGFAFAAIPARCALERQEWSAAAALPLRQPSGFPWQEVAHCESIVHYARAIGAARSGQLELARAEIAELDKVGETLRARRVPAYWIAQAEVQSLAARAWVAQAEKRPDEAVALLRRAADLEASVDKEAVTPGEVLPAGDLLGDLYLQLQRPADALAAYESVLSASPNRLNTLYGAALAAEKSGDSARARQYLGQILAIAPTADPDLPAIAHARRALSTARRQ